MSVDVEDYFHVSAFEGTVSREQWNGLSSRVCANTERLLTLFAEAGVHATFFVLGWVADRHRGLVRQIADEGHELASHSYWHRLVYTLTPEAFREDLRRARATIEDAAGVRVRGFRAPSYSITAESLWALEILAEEGYAYDASIFPIRHDRYGIPDAPRAPHRPPRAGGRLLEIPGTTVLVAGAKVPIGGGYFRLLPYTVTHWGITRLNRLEGRPAIFYVHPWEIDPDQPRLAAPLLSRLRHYNHLAQTESRLKRLLSDFKWGSVERVLLDGESGAGAAPEGSGTAARAKAYARQE